MAQLTFSSGNLNNLNPGNLVITPPNPLEVAMKQAQLRNLLQQPELERQKLILEQQDRARMFEALKQQGTQAAATLAEDTRYHTGELAHGQAALDAAREERLATTKGNMADTMLTHLPMLEQQNILPKGTTANALAKMGFPEIASAMSEATAAETKKKAATLAGQFGLLTPDARAKQMSALDPETRAAVQAALPTTATAPTAAAAPITAETGAPGFDLSKLTGGRSVTDLLKYAPVDTANLGVLAANYGALPIMNTLNSAFGIRPIPKQKPLPRDYSQINFGQ